jgi:hypothetical protein
LTSSQLVLSAVPPLSWKLFIIARLVSSSALVNKFWKNSFSVLSPLTLGSSVLDLGFSESRMVLVTLSQFIRACGRVVPAFVAVVEAEAEELARAGAWHEPNCVNLGAYRRTIGSIAYETTPSSLRDLDKTDLNLDFTYNEAGLFRVDLTL